MQNRTESNSSKGSLEQQPNAEILYGRKGLLLIIASLIFVLILSLGYFVMHVNISTSDSALSLAIPSPSQIPTGTEHSTIADWKTYKNTQYRFEIMLPQEYIKGCDDFLNKLPLGDSANSLCFSTGLTPNWFEGAEQPLNAFIINVLERKQDKDFVAFVSDEIDVLTTKTKLKYKINYPIFSKIGSMNIAGQQAEIYAGFSPWSKLIFVSHPNNQQVLILGQLEHGVNQNRFEQILSNLRFSDRPSNPKTAKYTNSQFSFEFEYPENILIEANREKPRGDLDVIISLIKGWFAYPYSSELSLLVNPVDEVPVGKQVEVKRFNGIDWKVTTDYSCGPEECTPPTYYYQTTHNNMKIVISNIATVEYEPILQEILETFQFTKNNSISEAPSSPNIDSNYWYTAEVKQKSQLTSPPYIGEAYLRKPIADALGLQHYDNIENIVADTTETHWGSVNLNAIYYIYVTGEALAEKRYSDNYLTIDVKKLSSSSLIPYLTNHNYCKQDSDCIIRNAYYCSYGAYNHFESLKDHESGCTRQTFDDEKNTLVDTSCHQIIYSNPLCVDNTCTSKDRVYKTIACY